MRAFGEAKDEEAVGGDDDHGDTSARRVVSLKSGGAKAPAGEGLGDKRRREDRSANGDGEENGAPKRGVRGRGAATYQSSVVAAVHEGPRRDPPKSDPTRLLKVCFLAFHHGMTRCNLSAHRRSRMVRPHINVDGNALLDCACIVGIAVCSSVASCTRFLSRQAQVRDCKADCAVHDCRLRG